MAELAEDFSERHRLGRYQVFQKVYVQIMKNPYIVPDRHVDASVLDHSSVSLESRQTICGGEGEWGI